MATMQTTGPHYKMSPGKGAGMCFLALFMPPLAVACVEGCNGALAFNLLLTLLGWVPGMIHSFYITCKHTAEPCCTHVHAHCHSQCHGQGQYSNMERGEGMTTHHYQTADGGVEVQTTVRVPGHGGTLVGARGTGNGGSNSDGTGSQAYIPAQSHMQSGPTSPRTELTMRAYEAQVPAYEQTQISGAGQKGEVKPFKARH